MPLEPIFATNDYKNNDPNAGYRSVDSQKLLTIYQRLRAEVFLGGPLHENQGDNQLAIVGKFFPIAGLPQGNYGWQLFRTPQGTAMLEYIGPVTFEEHLRKPLPLGKEKSLDLLEITFHQDEPAVGLVRKIIHEETAAATARASPTYVNPTAVQTPAATHA